MCLTVQETGVKVLDNVANLFEPLDDGLVAVHEA